MYCLFEHYTSILCIVYGFNILVYMNHLKEYFVLSM